MIPLPLLEQGWRVGKNYRLLKIGEKKRPGDEVYLSGKWRKFGLDPEGRGHTFNDGDIPVRRAVIKK
jgi:hypothetical protein